MEKKVLSIGIAAYNMERYLRRCIDSLLIPSLDKLEIIIVNNASTDATPVIAHEYANRVPTSIKVIDIDVNHHYGGAVNAAFASASGKFFKLLDADDWYDTTSLEILVSRLTNIETDVVYTEYACVYEGRGELIKKKVNQLPFNTIIDIRDVEVPDAYLEMHGIMYKTSFLKNIGYKQTEDVYYSDTEYVYYPFMYANTFIVLDISLYRYYLGRDGQSVSYKSYSKNISHFEKMYDRREFEKAPDSIYSFKLQTRLLYYIFFIGILLNYNKVREQMLRNRYDRIKRENPPVLISLLSKKFYGVPFVRIWSYKGVLPFFLLAPIRALIKIKYKL